MSSERDQVYPGPKNPDMFEERSMSSDATKPQTRESGFYWIRFSNLSEYEIGKWVAPLGWAMFWTEQYFPDHKLFEIDEHRITREEPIAAKISGTTERIAQNE